MLEALGYAADLVENGLAAVDAVAHRRYDLVLMDVQMPLMDGLEATRRIRRLPQPQPFIVAMTASVLDSDRQQCVEAGMDRHLPKPIRRQELDAILHEAAALHPEPAASDAANPGEAAVERLAGEVGREGAVEVLDAMIGGAAQVCRNLDEALALRDFARLRRELHSMKADCRTAEEAAAQGGEARQGGLEPLLRSIADQYRELSAELTRQRQRLQTAPLEGHTGRPGTEEPGG
jgi:CheY-like chemotaxis protein